MLTRSFLGVCSDNDLLIAFGGLARQLGNPVFVTSKVPTKDSVVSVRDLLAITAEGSLHHGMAPLDIMTSAAITSTDLTLGHLKGAFDCPGTPEPP